MGVPLTFCGLIVLMSNIFEINFCFSKGNHHPLFMTNPKPFKLPMYGSHEAFMLAFMKLALFYHFA